MKDKDLTIIEIAELSGVSVSTVSRVLNNHKSVSDKTRQRVNEIITQFGYTPSMFARGMINKTSKTIAVLVSDITNPYFISLIAEIEASIYEYGYSLMLMNTTTAGHNRTPNVIKAEVDTFNTILGKQVDGVIILGGQVHLDTPDAYYIQELNRMSQKIPTVILGQKVDGVTCPFIERDLEKGVLLLTMHMLSLGYSNIAFVGGEAGVSMFEARRDAFEKTMKLYVPDATPLVIQSDFYAEDGYSAAETIHKHHPEVQAVLAINDVVARGFLRYCLDHDIRNPQDIAIGSCDMFLNHDYSIPRFTTINQHNEYLTRIAIQKLITMIDETPFTAVSQHSPELVIGETCGAKK